MPISIWPLGWNRIILVFIVGRFLEIIIWTTWSLIFHGFYLPNEEKPGPLSGRRRIVILSLVDYLEFIFWFAFIYRLLASDFNVTSLVEPINALSFSFVNMTGIGISPDVDLASVNFLAVRFIPLIQSMIGVFMALTVFARVMNILPEPQEPKKEN